MWGELAPPTAPQERLCPTPGGLVAVRGLTAALRTTPERFTHLDLLRQPRLIHVGGARSPECQTSCIVSSCGTCKEGNSHGPGTMGRLHPDQLRQKARRHR